MTKRLNLAWGIITSKRNFSDFSEKDPNSKLTTELYFQALEFPSIHITYYIMWKHETIYGVNSIVIVY